jgi:hypothetical protein
MALLLMFYEGGNTHCLCSLLLYLFKLASSINLVHLYTWDQLVYKCKNSVVHLFAIMRTTGDLISWIRTEIMKGGGRNIVTIQLSCVCD